MENELITINNQEVLTVINTLKEIKPRGFKSMDRLVGLVMFFEGKLKTSEMKQAVEVENHGSEQT